MRTNVDVFSYSQFDLWHSSRKSYYRVYGLGEEKFTSPYLEKGRMFMTAMELGIFEDPDPLLPDIVAELPKLSTFEEKIEYEFPEGMFAERPLVAYLDCADVDLSVFGEYKTGKHPWDQDAVDNSTQLLFYATIIWMKTGKRPIAYLTWVQTEESDSGEIYYTGNHWTFARKFTGGDIVKMKRDILNAMDEIKEYQHDELEISDKIADKLTKLKGKRDSLNARIKMLENEVKNSLDFNKKKYGASSNHEFSLVERTTYAYDDNIKMLENELKNRKKEARDAGEVDITVSPSSLRITDVKL